MSLRTKLLSLITLCFGCKSFFLSFRLLQSSPAIWELNEIYEYIPIRQSFQSKEYNITKDGQDNTVSTPQQQSLQSEPINVNNTAKETSFEAASNSTESSFYVLPHMDSPIEQEYIQRIQSTYMKQKDNQTERRYISMSLYGNDKKYVEGAIENLKLQPTYFPGWTMRIYASPSYTNEFLEKLKSYGAEVVHPPSFLVNGTMYAMFWRFLIHDDPHVDRWISRDADSRLNARDYFAVEEWIESGKGSHTIRDHRNHDIFVNGGLWGSTKGSLFSSGDSNMTNAIQSFLGKCDKEWGCDNWFIEEEIWPRMKNDHLGHDAFRCDKKPNSIGFPTPRDKNGQFVGQRYVKVFSVPDNQPRWKGARLILDYPVNPQCDRHRKEE